MMLLATTAAPALEGRVHDLSGQGLSGFPIRWTMDQDPSVQLVVISGTDGAYRLPDELVRTAPRSRPGLVVPRSMILEDAVRIPWSTSEGLLDWEISDLRGRSLRSGTSRATRSDGGEIAWDGADRSRRPAPPGVYFLRTTDSRTTSVTRLFKTGNGSSASPPPVPRHVTTDMEASRSLWDAGVTWTASIEKSGWEPLRIGRIPTESVRVDLAVAPLRPVPFATAGKYLGRRTPQGDLERIFLRGVNLGIAVPGTQPGELAASREQIRSWLERIGRAGFDCIRTYTLHFPHFYEELAAYNNTHWEHPLYLFQGIWLDEEIPDDLYASSTPFHEAIREAVDGLHGNREIPVRFGRAYGSFKTNVSPWLMGWIMGREVYPDQITITDEDNPARSSYAGEAVSLAQGSPSEIWFTEALDVLVRYERGHYGSERPVSVSSWPTLDPLAHPTEVAPSQEDQSSLDLGDLDMSAAPGGYFASYHAYPYYPDFMSVQPEYRSASDSSGPNSYLGYLRSLNAHYDRVPLVVAEFGVPSSWGNAHQAHSGMHHGGHDEATQGRYDVRQLENIHASGSAGGFVFSWIDEWFKNAWITEPISSPAVRRPLWHDLTNPEQNFGLVAFDVPPPDFSAARSHVSPCGIRIATAPDHAFFHLQVVLGSAWNPGDTVEIGLDTYSDSAGERLAPSGTEMGLGAEFVLQWVGDEALLAVTRAYDLFGIWHGASAPDQLYRSVASTGGPWDLVRWKNNRGEDDVFEIGRLRVHGDSTSRSSLDALDLHGDTLHVRIPWTLLQFTDPSRLQTMDDDRSTAARRETATSEGIAVWVGTRSCRFSTPRQAWPGWDRAPEVVEREKESLPILEEALRTGSWNPLP